MMNETEIVKYLKENKCNGVAFMLMPQEVKEWCKEHEDEPIFSRLRSAGWDYAKRAINTLEKDAVYFLSQDYEIKDGFKADLVEYENELLNLTNERLKGRIECSGDILIMIDDMMKQEKDNYLLENIRHNVCEYLRNHLKIFKGRS